MDRSKSAAPFLGLALFVVTGCTLPLDGRSGAGGAGGAGATGGPQTSSGTTGTGVVVDTIPPTVVSTSPANADSNVLVGSPILATLSEDVDPSTVTGATFTVTNKGAPVAGAITLAGATIAFTPANDLALAGSFVAKLSTAVADLAGNKLASPFMWSFTTAVPPTVIATSPNDGDADVATTRHVVATFSGPMNPATLTPTTFVVRQDGTVVPGKVTAVGATATFAPMVGYAPSTMLMATITTGARDLAGNGLAQDHVWSFQTGTKVTQLPVDLGLASTFGVLAGDKVANTVSAGTMVTGDLGISPGADLSGFPPGMITGVTYTGITAAPFQASAAAAYNDASTRPGDAALAADIAGLTFAPGLYHQAAAVALSAGTCTLDAEGDPSAVFIFQIGTAFSLAANTQIVLIGGAKPANITWAAGAAAKMGANAKLAGTILSLTAITLGAGAKVDGRLFAKAASVTLDTNLITVPAP